MPISIVYGEAQQLTLDQGKNFPPDNDPTINFGSDLVDNSIDKFDDVLIMGIIDARNWPSSATYSIVFSDYGYYSAPYYVFGSDTGNFNYGLAWELSQANSGILYQYQTHKLLCCPRFGSGTTIFGPVSIANKFDGMMPQKWGIYTKNVYSEFNGAQGSFGGSSPIKEIWYQGIKFVD